MNTEAIRFYTALARHYDELFPADADVLSFLQQAGASAGSRVLDLACGTGLYTDALVESGADAHGADGSEELIALGRRRSAHPERLHVMDMGELARYPRDRLDLLFCIGNSVAHLGDWTALRQLLADAVGLCKRPAGSIVIQHVEMESVDVGSVRALPPLTAGDLTFERIYVRTEPDHMIFRSALADAGSGRRDELEMPLLVVRAEEVQAELDRLGCAAEIAGGFSGQPAEGSWVRVIRATLR